MARQFNIPVFYKSDIISRVKKYRQAADSRKKDLEPSELNFGPIRFILGRHFGFCFGVENAIIAKDVVANWRILMSGLDTHDIVVLVRLAPFIEFHKNQRSIRERSMRVRLTFASTDRMTGLVSPFSDLTHPFKLIAFNVLSYIVVGVHLLNSLNDLIDVAHNLTIRGQRRNTAVVILKHQAKALQ